MSNAMVGVIWLPSAAVQAMAKVIPTDPAELGTKEELINSITLKCQALGIWWRNWRSEVAYANFNWNKIKLIRISKIFEAVARHLVEWYALHSACLRWRVYSCMHVGMSDESRGKKHWPDEWSEEWVEVKRRAWLSHCSEWIWLPQSCITGGCIGVPMSNKKQSMVGRIIEVRSPHDRHTICTAHTTYTVIYVDAVTSVEKNKTCSFLSWCTYVIE